MQSLQNVAIVKIPFRSRAMAFSNNPLLFCSHGKGICDWQQWYSIGNSGTGVVSRGQTSNSTGPYRLQYRRPWGAYAASDNARAKKRSGHARLVLGIHRCYTMSKRSLERKYTH